MGFINQHWFITGSFSWLSQVMKSKSPIFPSLIFTHTHTIIPRKFHHLGLWPPPFVTDFAGSPHRPPQQCCCYMGCPDLGDTKWPVVQDILGKQTYDSLLYIYTYVWKITMFNCISPINITIGISPYYINI